MILPLVLSILMGYALGAIPTGVLVARFTSGVDVRGGGSGHTGGTNVARVTGNRWAGILTVLIDVGLGALSVIAARIVFDSPWAPAFAGPAAVVGHGWSVFIGFSGGIGLSSLAGMLLAQAPLATLVAGVACIVAWLMLRKLLRHDARATIVVLLLIPIGLWALGQPVPVISSAGLGALSAIVRSLGDWKRRYSPNEGALGQLRLRPDTEAA